MRGIGRDRDQPLQQRAERGLLAVGQRPLLGGDRVVGARLDGIVGDGEHLVGRARAAGARRPTTGPRPPAGWLLLSQCMLTAPAFPTRSIHRGGTSDPTDFRPGLLCPDPWESSTSAGGLGESWEQAERPPCQNAGTTARRSPIATRASTSTPAMPWWRPSSRWRRSTRRRGADADLGGFGALFDLKAAGFKDPILVAANDGVGTKLKIAIETGLHATIGIDLVAMCVNDLLGAGRRAAVLPRLFRLRQARRGDGAQRWSAGIAEGCRQAGCALIGGETAEMPGMYAARTTISRALPSARSSAAASCRAPTLPRATC